MLAIVSMRPVTLAGREAAYLTPGTVRRLTQTGERYVLFQDGPRPAMWEQRSRKNELAGCENIRPQTVGLVCLACYVIRMWLGQPLPAIKWTF